MIGNPESSIIKTLNLEHKTITTSQIQVYARNVKVISFCDPVDMVNFMVAAIIQSANTNKVYEYDAEAEAI